MVKIPSTPVLTFQTLFKLGRVPAKKSGSQINFTQSVPCNTHLHKLGVSSEHTCSMKVSTERGKHNYVNMETLHRKKSIFKMQCEEQYELFTDAGPKLAAQTINDPQ